METMRKPRKLSRVSIYVKILSVFVLVLFPIYLINVYLNIRAQEVVRTQVIRSSEDKVSFYLKLLETEFDNIIKLEASLVNNEKLKNINANNQNMGDYELFMEMNSIRQLLESYKQMNRYIKSLSVYIPNINRKISNTVIEEINIEEYRMMQSFIEQRKFPFANHEGRIFMNIPSQLYANQASQETYNDMPFMISVEVNILKLKETLKEISGSTNARAFLAGSDRGLLVLNSDTDELVLSHISIDKSENEFGNKLSPYTKIKNNKTTYLVFKKPSMFLHTSLVIYISENELLGIILEQRKWLLFMSILTLFMVAVFSFWIKGMIAEPLNRLIKSFKKVNEGYYDIRVKYDKGDEFGYLYNEFNELFAKLKSLIEQVYEQRVLVKNAELKQLQYQINPHFLYNSLLIVNSLIKMEDYETALKLSQHLGSYYQYITRSSTDEVPLMKEIEHAKDYVQIQGIRFSNRIKAIFADIPYDAQNLIVPRLIIQPIIENAYKHGLKNKIKDGILKVQTFYHDSILEINVEDNGEELKDETLIQLKNRLELNEKQSSNLNGEISGLFNVNRRLKMKFGDQSGLFAERSEMGGLKITIKIDFKSGGSYV